MPAQQCLSVEQRFFTPLQEVFLLLYPSENTVPGRYCAT